jgi:UDP-N-acetylglucosamine acyltransferase
VLGGYTGVHQFCRIGAHCMTAVGTVVLQDIPPFVMAAGNTASPYGINAEGLKRRGFSPDALMVLKRAYRTLYKSGLMLEEARAKLEDEVKAHAELQPILDFLTLSKRGIIR